MDDAEKAKLKSGLRQFTGSGTFYRHPLFRKFVYTEGVQYLAEKARAYWFLEYIFAKQEIKAIAKEGFQVWTIKAQENGGAAISVEDGNGNGVEQFHLTFTDFPFGEFTLWFIGGTLLLPNEY